MLNSELILLTEQLDALVLLQNNLELKLLSENKKEECGLENEKNAFRFAMLIIQKMVDQNIPATAKIRDVELNYYIKHYFEKSLELAMKCNYPMDHIAQIFHKGEYFFTIFNKFKSGEIEY